MKTPKSKNILKKYPIYYIYIYTDMDLQNTTTEPLSEEGATKQQQKLTELRRYNREYYHAHKNASECEHCKKTFSSVSTLRRHK